MSRKTNGTHFGAKSIKQIEDEVKERLTKTFSKEELSKVNVDELVSQIVTILINAI